MPHIAHSANLAFRNAVMFYNWSLEACWWSRYHTHTLLHFPSLLLVFNFSDPKEPGKAIRCHEPLAAHVAQPALGKVAGHWWGQWSLPLAHHPAARWVPMWPLDTSRLFLTLQGFKPNDALIVSTCHLTALLWLLWNSHTTLSKHLTNHDTISPKEKPVKSHSLLSHPGTGWDWWSGRPMAARERPER